MSAGELVFSGSMLLAIPVAIIAGFLSFVSPCVLPLVPGYFSYITGLSDAELKASESSLSQRSRIMVATLGFIAGFSFLFVSYGLAFGQLGNWFLQNERIVSMILGALVIVMGAGYLGWIPAMNQDFRPRFHVKDGAWTAPLLGLLFGLGWAPCVGPTLAAVQTLAFTEANALRGAVLSVAYCIGLGLPFLLIALAYKKSLVATRFLRQHSRIITRIGGAFLVAIGFALVTGVWADITAALRTFAAGYGVFL
jgi:cytochrome c-type biogenesis protein